MRSPDSFDGSRRTTSGLENRRSYDRARRRAMSRLLAAHRAEHHQLAPRGQRGTWRHSGPAARILKDRYPAEWQKLLAAELAREDYAPIYQRKAAS